ncbi:MAG: hypothetical protein ACKVGW_05795 [Verrucomicrobiia bacterium]
MADLVSKNWFRAVCHCVLHYRMEGNEIAEIQDGRGESNASGE